MRYSRTQPNNIPSNLNTFIWNSYIRMQHTENTKTILIWLHGCVRLHNDMVVTQLWPYVTHISQKRPDSVPGQFMWDLWWTKRHYGGFSQGLLYSLANHHSTNTPHLSIIHGQYNGPITRHKPSMSVSHISYNNLLNGTKYIIKYNKQVTKHKSISYSYFILGGTLWSKNMCLLRFPLRWVL